jgi:hypothetical protein
LKYILELGETGALGLVLGKNSANAFVDKSADVQRMDITRTAGGLSRQNTSQRSRIRPSMEAASAHTMSWESPHTLDGLAPPDIGDATQ